MYFDHRLADRSSECPSDRPIACLTVRPPECPSDHPPDNPFDCKSDGPFVLLCGCGRPTVPPTPQFIGIRLARKTRKEKAEAAKKDGTTIKKK